MTTLVSTSMSRGSSCLKERLKKHIHTKPRTERRDCVKSFRDIPGPMTLPFMSTPMHVLPHIGTYHNVVGITMMRKYYNKYGDIVRLGNNLSIPPAIFIFKPEYFEQIYQSGRVSKPVFTKSPLAHFHEQISKPASAYTINQSELPEKSDDAKPNISNPQILKEVATETIAKNIDIKQKQYRITDSNIFYEYAIKCIGKTVDVPNISDETLREISSALKENFESGFNFKSAATVKENSSTFQQALQCFKNLYRSLEKASGESENQRRANKLTNMANLMFSQVDKIVHTSIALLYYLSLNPAKQQILHDEIRNGGDRSYLHACLQETERITPLTGANVRRTDEDIVLEGFRVPEGVDLILSHHLSTQDQKHYSRPNDFIPERWLVDRKHALHHGHAHIHAYPSHESRNSPFINQSVECLIEAMIDRFDTEWHGPKMQLETKSLNHYSPPYYFVLHCIP